jgi:hypothetical protein
MKKPLGKDERRRKMHAEWRKLWIVWLLAALWLAGWYLYGLAQPNFMEGVP